MQRTLNRSVVAGWLAASLRVNMNNLENTKKKIDAPSLVNLICRIKEQLAALSNYTHICSDDHGDVNSEKCNK